MAAIIYLIVTITGLGFAALIGINGPQLGPISVVLACAIFAFGLNWLVFIPSWIARTEKFFDLTGAITYLSVTLMALYFSEDFALPKLVVAGMVCVWAVRLGSMLYARIKRDGEDKRFRVLKKSALRFFGVWTIQGLWVTLTMGCALAILTSLKPIEFGVFFIVGALMWGVGFIIEVIADRQKNAFRAIPENHGRFIQTGLWAWSQHPNYFGEILLWSGIAIIALPLLSGIQYIALTSPVFVLVLLTKVSGIPLLDKAAMARWGEDAAYLDYRKRTSKLIPLPPGR